MRTATAPAGVFSQAAAARIARPRARSGIYLRRKYSSYGVSFLTSTPPSTVKATPVIMRAA